MANKHRGEPRVYVHMTGWIREGLCNQEVLEQIRRKFPDHRTSPEQVRARRCQLRQRGEDIPTSVEARQRKRTKLQRNS
jgi:hypothetical protein